MRIIELFAGIGASSKALKNMEINIEIVDAIEIDKYAMKSFNAIHNTNFETQDIRNWKKHYENIDLICHGSPCQDFSIAGKQQGGDEGSGTRSSLMYETIRIVKDIRPKYVLWENVKNLLSKKHIHNFRNYLNILDTLGYNNYYQVINAKDYGIPQNRERVYTISIRKDIDKGIFEFPEKVNLKLKLKDLLEDNVDEKYYLKSETTKNLIISKNNTNVIGNLEPKILIKNATKKGYLEAYEGDSINLAYPNSSTRRGRIGHQISQTIQCNDSMGIVDNNIKIRKLTPLECWRLMGFSDEDFKKAKNAGNSNTQLYKQAGNSIVVNVLEKIFENLVK